MKTSTTKSRLSPGQRAQFAAMGVDPDAVGRVVNRAGQLPRDIAIPANSDELTDFMADPGRFKSVLADKDTLTSFINAYASKTQGDGTELQKMANEAAQAALVQMLKDNGAEHIKRLNLGEVNPYKNQTGKRTGLNSPHAKGTPLNGKLPDITTFFQAAWHGANPNGEHAAVIREIRDYSERVPSEGGLLVPEEFRSEILRLSMESGIVRPRARVIPMGNPRINFPTLDETSRVSSVMGGIVVYRTEEGAELVESSATFASVKLDVTKQTALAHVPNELIKDWGAFDAFLGEAMPEAVSFYEDIDFLTGNGVGQPLGALYNHPAMITVAAESGQSATTIVWENIIRMYARMLPSSINRAVWIASPDVFFELATMALTVGTGGSAVWLTDAKGSPQLTLLGRPVIMSEKAPAALGTQGDISFVDLGMYLLGDYQSMSVESSAHVKFTSDKTTYRVIQRNDGRPWLLSPITPHNNSATLSGFVQLATR